jgi:hypothetical protein
MTKTRCSACGRPAKAFMECLGVIVCSKCGEAFELSNDEMTEADRWKAIWAGKIRAAQLVRTILIEGAQRKRIRYGNEYPDWSRERAWISLSRERSVKRLPDQKLDDWIAAAGWPSRCFVLPGQRVARGYIASAISGIQAGDTKSS